MAECKRFLKASMKKQNETGHRSGCPINLTLEVVGDKWSLGSSGLSGKAS
jgi:hypothetical protein